MWWHGAESGNEISIHALRKESDSADNYIIPHHKISIHALRKESDNWRSTGKGPPYLFQSTLSVRRATYRAMLNASPNGHFNPRSP